MFIGFRRGLVFRCRYVMMIFSILFVMADVLQSGSTSKPPDFYTAIIDAGSSGSRIFVYRVRCNSKDNVILVSEAGDALKIEPGLSAFVGQPRAAVESLEPLLSHATRIIPVEKHKSTTLYLLATAGLRMLPELESGMIIDELRRELHLRSSFIIESSAIKIISGDIEGMYGWAAVNYLRGRIGGGEAARQGTVGVMDMGGGSAQVVYEAGFAPRETERLLTFEVGAPSGAWTQKYRLHVSTQLGYGANKARHRHVLRLHRQRGLRESSDRTIRDPCLPVGQIDVWPAEKLYPHPKPLTLVGTGQYYECRAVLSPLLNDGANDCSGKCYLPPPPTYITGMTWNGLSEFWYTMYDVLGIEGRYDASTFDEASAEFCSTEWATLHERHRAGKYPHASDSRMKLQCFKAAWISTMLHNGYDFPRDRSFSSISKIEGVDSDWALGAALDLSRNASCSAPPDSGRLRMFTICIFVLVLGSGSIFGALSGRKRSAILPI